MKCRAGIFLYSRRFLLPPPRLFLLFPVLAWHYIRNSTCSLPLLVLSLCSCSSSSTLFFTLVPSLLSELAISLWRRGAQTHEESRKYVVNKLQRKKKMIFFSPWGCFVLNYVAARKKMSFFYYYFDFYPPTPTIDLGVCSRFCSDFQG